MTYRFIGRLISDPRFAERSGVVFTEIGARDLQPELDALMATAGLDREEAGRRLVPLFRDLGIPPFWDSTNFYELLLDVYELNRSRPPERRIQVRFTDLSIPWEEMTAEGYRRFWKTEVPGRDRHLADSILEGFRELEEDEGRAGKALIILNYRHAFNDFRYADGGKGDDAGRYLFDALPGRVANVMLNALAWLPGPDGRGVVFEPIQGGLWDAAFRRAGIEEAGFDFAGSPFGADGFDYFTFREHDAAYQDVFDGFVFFRPISEHRLHTGIPGLFGDGFAAEAKRRVEVVVGPEAGAEALRESIEASDHLLVEAYDDPERLEAMIARWLTEPAGEGH